MAYRAIEVGADRFLALQWANFAFDLCRRQVDEESAVIFLKEYLAININSAITIRKTTNQLMRLWLAYDDPYKPLREKATKLRSLHQLHLLPILHLGLAINIFPIYKETISIIGQLHRITTPVLSRTIADRVLEKFPNPSSIPYTVPKVLRSLEDWGFISYEKGSVMIKEISVLEEDFVNWFLLSLITALDQKEITFQELEVCPLKLGITLAHPRKVITLSTDLSLTRNAQGVEVIGLSR